MDELREQFLIEARDLIEDTARHFAALSLDRQASGAIDGAFRAIHTLKGSVALFALAPAEQVLHAAEDVLDCARKGTRRLDAEGLRALIAGLDRVDGWIDRFERIGELPADAATVAADCLAALRPDRDATGAAPAGQGGADWLGGLRQRFAASLAEADQPLTAFRYRPDRDCFFRGDDPLATVRAVPGLVDLAILPRAGEAGEEIWPDAATFEPFACVALFEGLSTANLEAVREAFRLAPDQIDFALIEPGRGEASAAQAGAEANGAAALRSFRVDPSRIDALGDLVGELLVAIHGIQALTEEAERIDRSLAARARACQAQIERATADLHRGIGQVRSVPVESGLRRLPRLVREIAQGLGKDVEFVVAGQDIEVDRHVADSLFEPLLHLLRNALDHGIEDQARRHATGKSPIGRVVLGFRRERDMIVVELADDGAGMDPMALRKLAVARGLMAEEEAASLSDAEALRLIFLPGFSAAREVTEISGRGVGMDAVQVAIARLRGTIEIDSEIGVGTRFRLVLPATTLATRLLVIEAGGERYGVALDQIEETLGERRAAVTRVGRGHACVWQGRTVPVLDLAALLGSAASFDNVALPEGAFRQEHNGRLVVVRSGGEPVAVRVDAFCERIDAMVRPANGMLARIPGMSGSALLSDGRVLLVLDLQELAA